MTNYNDLNEILAGLSPSEAHGLLIPFIYKDPKNALLLWIKELSRITEDGIKEGTPLVDLYKDTTKALSSIELTFEPLINKEKSLNERFEMLKEWIQGFIFSIGVNNIEINNEDLKEFIEDLMNFENTDLEEISEEEEEEHAFEDLFEYIRMGVILFHQESL